MSKQVPIQIQVDKTERQTAFAQFMQLYPSWQGTQILDHMRETEYARLDQQGHVYLDYTGGGLYADSQVREHTELMCNNVFGNPHSHNPTSQAMTDHVEGTRAAILKFFNASPDKYTVVFTPNASGALKLVGESYPFCHGSQYVLTSDNHNSVNGIREFASAKGAKVTYLSLEQEDLRLNMDEVRTVLWSADRNADNLFSFPAQSNYSGVKHPLDLVEKAQGLGWDVLLDCAAYAPTSRMDFSKICPDFAAFSFYKMFGYPTGCGALIVKRDKLPKLTRPWFAGGTIQIASVAAGDHVMVDGEAAFEDGTVNYLMWPAVRIGLRHLEKIGMETISTRVHCLTDWLLQTLATIKHENGQRMVQIHGPVTNKMRGGTITLNLYDPNGVPYSGARLEELAGDAKISLRTGCFCNPGAGEKAHQMDEALMLEQFSWSGGKSFQQVSTRIRALRGVEISSIRVSVGLVSNFNDVYYLIQFVKGLMGIPFDSLGDAVVRQSQRDSA